MLDEAERRASFAASFATRPAVAAPAAEAPPQADESCEEDATGALMAALAAVQRSGARAAVLVGGEPEPFTIVCVLGDAAARVAEAARSVLEGEV